MKFKVIGTLPEFRSGSEEYVNPLDWSIYEEPKYTGSQAPTLQLLPDRIRVWFSARDSQKRSHPFYYDLDRNDPTKVIDTLGLPFIPLGLAGEADDSGVMLSQVLSYGFKYAGWNTGNQHARYRTACMTYNNRGNKCIQKDRDSMAPCGSSMPFIDEDDGSLYYMAYVAWIKDSNGLAEPVYRIAVDPRYDSWADDVNPRYLTGSSYSAARPVVFEDKLFYCRREHFDYRTNPKNSYKMVYRSIKGYDEWVGEEVPITIEGGENDLMQAYGYPLRVDNKAYMFYNHDFVSQICVAELVNE